MTNANLAKIDYDLSGLDTISDFNSPAASVAGKHKVYATDGVVANSPLTGVIGGYLEVTVDADKYYQMYRPFAPDNIYIRLWISGQNYGTWKALG